MADNGTTKDLQAIQEQTIQSRQREPGSGGGGISVLSFLVHSGDLIAPWWSRQRDIDLERLMKQSSHMESAIYKVITKLSAILPRVEPRDATIKAHMRQADQYNRVLIEDSEFGQGWPALVTKAYLELFSQDNGFFWEVIGEGAKDGPIVGPALGLASLDAQRCTRTSDAEYPVIYADTDGQRYKLHHTRVIYKSQLPSPRATMNGVGRCWTSRAVDIAQNLVDISTYKQEKLGSRPARQMIIGKGISSTQIWQAFMAAEEDMDNQRLQRYAKNVVIGAADNTDVDITTVDLASVPDGFDERTATEMGMFVIALAGGFPPRDLWPATTVGATKADAMFQHVGGSAGYQSILDMITFALGGSPVGSRHQTGKFLPPHLKLVFDLVDDDQDERQAKIRFTRSETREKNLTSGVTDIRTERELSLSAGDLTQAQFDALELADGRLPDGSSVLSLFYSSDPTIQSMLRLSVGDPLDLEMNRSQADFIIEQIKQRILDAMVLLANGGRANQQALAKQVLAALEVLREMYEGAGGEQPEEEPEEGEGAEELEDKAADAAYCLIDIPFETEAQVMAVAATIEANDLHEMGVEYDSHVTVKYGLDDTAADAVREIAADFAPFDIKIVGLSLFENEGVDVLKFDIEGAQLRRLNAAIGELPNIDSRPDYNPHMTVAYLKAGRGEAYLGPTALDGQTVRIKAIIFSDTNRERVQINL